MREKENDRTEQTEHDKCGGRIGSLHRHPIKIMAIVIFFKFLGKQKTLPNTEHLIFINHLNLTINCLLIQTVSQFSSVFPLNLYSLSS